jgi:MtN3 and saliva related transmembrane protein
MNAWTQEIGLVAGSLTTLAFIPQLLRIWRTRSARDVSLGMFVVFVAGIILWLVYGVLRHDIVVILANAVTLVLALAILALKIKFDR